MSIKKNYSQQEWDKKSDSYTQAIQMLKLPEVPGTKEVMLLESRIDQVLSEAMIDRAYVKSHFDRVDNELKLREKELSFQIRMTPEIVTNEPLTKPTEKMIDGLVVRYLTNNEYESSQMNIYQVKRLYAERFNFIEEVVRVLHDKKTAIEIMARMLKIESNFKETVD